MSQQSGSAGSPGSSTPAARDRTGASTFLNPHQRATIEAAMARIIPSDEQPGAREADTVTFIDRYLSGIGYIYAKPDGQGFEELEGKRAQAWQQRITILQTKYVEGVGELDRRSRGRFGVDFTELSGEQQDRILSDMERPEQEAEQELETAQSTAGFAPVEPAMQQVSTETDIAFFPLLALHTRQGFYADPIYGGNKDHVGWKLIGFEGPESLAETHAGRYSTLPYFAEQPADLGPGSQEEEKSGE